MKKKETLKDKLSVPVSVRWISASFFLFMVWWWLGWDTFFSVYVKSILWAWLWVTLIWTLLAVVKLLVTIPVGVMNDQWNTRYLLLLWKLIYAVSWCLYFTAWINHSAWWLVLAVIANGIASATMFTSYRNLYWKKGKAQNRSKVFWVYFSSMNLAYVIWAILSAVLVYYIDLPYMYLFIVIFSLLSVMQDNKIQDLLKKRFSKSWKKLENRDPNIEYEIDEDLDNVKKLLGKKWVVPTFMKEIVSPGPWKSMFVTLKGYWMPMYVALGAEALVCFMNYVGFLFIPIIALENNLTLSQIAILFAVMKLPYMISVLFWWVWDKYSKKIIITILVILSAIIYILLGFYSWFFAIVLLSFLISLMVALLSPITSALVTWYTKPKDNGVMSGLQEFVWRIWEIIWALWFWGFATLVWMNNAFVILWVALGVLGVYLLAKKIINRKNKDNEALKEKMAHIPIGGK